MPENSNQPMITFSLRPFTLGEIELADKCSKGDLSAGIDLCVKRADPPVTRAQLEALTESEATEVFRKLGQTMGTVKALEKLFGGLT